jgi:hypothetical protein
VEKFRNRSVGVINEVHSSRPSATNVQPGISWRSCVKSDMTVERVATGSELDSHFWRTCSNAPS